MYRKSEPVYEIIIIIHSIYCCSITVLSIRPYERSAKIFVICMVYTEFVCAAMVWTNYVFLWLSYWSGRGH